MTPTLTDAAGNIFIERKNTPFSLTCVLCDAGQGIETLEAARLLGWSHIEFNDGPWWNYLGVCPDCRKEYEG